MTLAEPHSVLSGSPYQGYVYAYPHKTAYRSFAPRALRDVWAGEERGALFLYVHVPFCTMRCGFCNLFTTANPNDDLVSSYLAALRRQADAVCEAIPDAQFAQFAIGGGTPTYLSEAELAEVFDLAENVMGARSLPGGVETSPDTLTPAKLDLLKARGVSRVSIGVQSFIEKEAADSGRPQRRADVDTALSMLADSGVRTVNVDLIYGLPGQTPASWRYSLNEALRYSPQELYLYPLYVRPLTALGSSRREWDDARLALYRDGRDVLLAAGYEQVSMRMFRMRSAECEMRSEDNSSALHSSIPHSELRTPHLKYCCQTDGMFGLGCGARSYTRALHYSLDYAVRPKSVKGIIADYLARSRDELSRAEHGFALDGAEQRRRYLLQSILNTEGLCVALYMARFGSDPADDFPDLPAFAELGLLRCDGGTWTPTARGLERSDALGPWFFSRAVRDLIMKYELK